MAVVEATFEHTQPVLVETTPVATIDTTDINDLAVVSTGTQILPVDDVWIDPDYAPLSDHVDLLSLEPEDIIASEDVEQPSIGPVAHIEYSINNPLGVKVVEAVALDTTHVRITFTVPMKTDGDLTSINNIAVHSITGGEWAVTVINFVLNSSSVITLELDTDMDGDESNYYYECDGAVLSGEGLPLDDPDYYFAGVGIGPQVISRYPTHGLMDVDEDANFQIELRGGSEIVESSVQVWYRKVGIGSWDEAVLGGVIQPGFSGTCDAFLDPKGVEIDIVHPTLLNEEQYELYIYAVQQDGQAHSSTITFQTAMPKINLAGVESFNYLHVDVWFDGEIKHADPTGPDDFTTVMNPAAHSILNVNPSWSVTVQFVALLETSPTKVRLRVTEMDGDKTTERDGNYLYMLNENVEGALGEPLGIRAGTFDGKGKPPSIIESHPYSGQTNFDPSADFVVDINGGSRIDVDSLEIWFRQQGAPSWIEALNGTVPGAGFDVDFEDIGIKGKSITLSHATPITNGATFDFHIYAQQLDEQDVTSEFLFQTNIIGAHIIDVVAVDSTHVNVTFDDAMNTDDPGEPPTDITSALNKLMHHISGGDWAINVSSVVAITPLTMRLTVTSMDGDAFYSYLVETSVENAAGEQVITNTDTFLGIGSPPFIEQSIPAGGATEIEPDDNIWIRLNGGSLIIHTTINVRYQIEGEGWVDAVINGAAAADHSRTLTFYPTKGWILDITHDDEFTPSSDYIVEVSASALDGQSFVDTFGFDTYGSLANVTNVVAEDDTHVLVTFDKEMKYLNPINNQHAVNKDIHHITPPPGSWPIVISSAVDTGDHKTFRLTVTSMDGDVTYDYEIDNTVQTVDGRAIYIRTDTFEGIGRAPALITSTPSQGQAGFPIANDFRFIVEGGCILDTDTLQVSYNVVGEAETDAIIDGSYVGGHSGNYDGLYGYKGRMITLIRPLNLTYGEEYVIHLSVEQSDSQLLDVDIFFDTIGSHWSVLQVDNVDETHINITFNIPMRNVNPGNGDDVSNPFLHTLTGGEWVMQVTTVTEQAPLDGTVFQLTLTEMAGLPFDSMDGDATGEAPYLYTANVAIRGVLGETHLDNIEYFDGEGVAPLLEYSSPAADDTGVPIATMWTFKLNGASEIQSHTISIRYRRSGDPDWIYALRNDIFGPGHSPNNIGAWSYKGFLITFQHPLLSYSQLYDMEIYARQRDTQSFTAAFTFTTVIAANVLTAVANDYQHITVTFDMAMKQTGAYSALLATSHTIHWGPSPITVISVLETGPMDGTTYQLTVSALDGDSTYKYVASGSMQGAGDEPIDNREAFFEGIGYPPVIIDTTPDPGQIDVPIDVKFAVIVEGGTSLDVSSAQLRYKKDIDPGYTDVIIDGDYQTPLYDGDIDDYNLKGKHFLLSIQPELDLASTYEFDFTIDDNDSQTASANFLFLTPGIVNLIYAVAIDETTVEIGFDAAMLHADPDDITHVTNLSVHEILGGDWPIVVTNVVEVAPLDGTVFQLTVTSMDCDASDILIPPGTPYTYTVDKTVRGELNEYLDNNTDDFNGMGVTPTITPIYPIPDDLLVSYTEDFDVIIDGGSEILEDTLIYQIDTVTPPINTAILNGVYQGTYGGSIQVEYTDKGIRFNITHDPLAEDTTYYVHIEVDDNCGRHVDLDYTFATPPTANVLTAGATDDTHVLVTFDRDMKNTNPSSAQDVSNVDVHSINNQDCWPIYVTAVEVVSGTQTILTVTSMEHDVAYEYEVDDTVKGAAEEPMGVRTAAFTGIGRAPEIIYTIPLDEQENVGINKDFEVAIKGGDYLDPHQLQVWYQQVDSGLPDVLDVNWTKGLKNGLATTGHTATISTYECKGKKIVLHHNASLLNNKRYVMYISGTQYDTQTVYGYIVFYTISLNTLGLQLINIFPPPSSNKAPKATPINFDLIDLSLLGIDVSETKIYVTINDGATTLIYENETFLGDWTNSAIYPDSHIVTDGVTTITIVDAQHFTLNHDTDFNYSDLITVRVVAQEDSSVPHVLDRTWFFWIKPDPCWSPSVSPLSEFETFMKDFLSLESSDILRLTLMSGLVPNGSIDEQVRRLFQVAYVNGLGSYLNEMPVDWLAVAASNVCPAWPLVTVWNEIYDDIVSLSNKVLVELASLYKNDFLNDLTDALAEAKIADRIIGLHAVSVLLSGYYEFITQAP